ncbi:MAG: dihydropteroate synthase [Candidatus Bipolaricaulota bacterium]
MLDLCQWASRRDRALVMGVVNVTADSFYAPSRAPSPREAAERAVAMVHAGADLLDVGGESTRPGSKSVSLQDELHSVLPAIEAIRDLCDVPLSVDTTKASVAREALKLGAVAVNDTSALSADPDMAGVVAEAGAFVVLMHRQGEPETMQRAPSYADVVGEVLAFLRQRAAFAEGHGVAAERIVVDPGIGFGKTLDHNLALLRATPRLASLGFPVLVGVSRKSFLGELLGLDVEARLEGTIAAGAVAVALGADILRVHDVKEGRCTADVAWRLRHHDA